MGTALISFDLSSLDLSSSDIHLHDLPSSDLSSYSILSLIIIWLLNTSYNLITWHFIMWPIITWPRDLTFRHRDCYSNAPSVSATAGLIPGVWQEDVQPATVTWTDGLLWVQSACLPTTWDPVDASGTPACWQSQVSRPSSWTLVKLVMGCSMVDRFRLIHQLSPRKITGLLIMS